MEGFTTPSGPCQNACAASDSELRFLQTIKRTCCRRGKDFECWPRHRTPRRSAQSGSPDMKLESYIRRTSRHAHPRFICCLSVSTAARIEHRAAGLTLAVFISDSWRHAGDKEPDFLSKDHKVGCDPLLLHITITITSSNIVVVIIVLIRRA